MGRSGLASVAHAAWVIWRTVLLVNTLGLLAVAAYAAQASSDDAPGAMPLLMAGLLSMCVIGLTVVSGVNAVLWASAARWPWPRRLALVPVVLLLGVLVFALALYGSDFNRPARRWIGLLLFVAAILGAHLLNSHAVRRYRGH
jgi:hypothetical protein